jgi:protoheme IX farnesyltransferase
MSLGATVQPIARPKVADYLALTKPRIAVMVLFTVAIGYVLAVPKSFHLLTLLNVMFGTALVAAGANTLNQWLERHIDAKMRRTMNRPLPAGRLTPAEVFLFGIAVSIIGLGYLFWTMPSLAAPIVALITLLSYVLIYTPLKTVTTMNTLIGAVPGALPPLIGWCAGRGEVTLEGWALFLVLFFWQLPHFWAIAWMYRQDYEDGGLKMLPMLDRSGRLTGYAMMLTCLCLVVVSLMPVMLKTVSVFYLLTALLSGILFFASTVKFFSLRTDRQARKVLRASLLYLPGVLGLWCLDVLVFKSFLPG